MTGNMFGEKIFCDDCDSGVGRFSCDKLYAPKRVQKRHMKTSQFRQL